MSFNGFFKIAAGLLLILELDLCAMDQASQYDAGPIRTKKHIESKATPSIKTHYLTPAQHKALIDAAPSDREKFMNLTNEEQKRTTFLAPVINSGDVIQGEPNPYQDQENERQQVSEIQKQMSDLQAEGKIDEADEAKRALNTAKQKLQYKGNEFTTHRHRR